MARSLCTLVLASALSCVAARRPVTEYTINLDLPPSERFKVILPQFNTTVWKFWDQYFANDKILTDALFALADIRGKEVEELQQEVEGLAAAAKLPVKFVQGIQSLYELQTLMVPIVNFTNTTSLPTGWTGPNGFAFPEGWEALMRIPWRGPGCTGIIATDSQDGTVYHARNLDFSPVDIMTHLVYTGIFTKGGKEVFRSQMVAGYNCLVTGLKKGPNGFSIERNTRYPDHEGGNAEMFKNLVGGRELNGWGLRKIMETAPDYESAVTAIEVMPYVSTEYAIVSGVKKGVILARDPDAVAHTQVLGDVNFGERGDYIIVTNFDFYWHDAREWFDPTGGMIGRPRRVEAQKILNKTAVLTPEVLFDTINAKGVIADTIFQSIINVEKGIWNVSQPDL